MHQMTGIRLFYLSLINFGIYTKYLAVKKINKFAVIREARLCQEQAFILSFKIEWSYNTNFDPNFN